MIDYDKLTPEMVDKFIERTCLERDYTLHTLLQEICTKSILSMPEVEIYPIVVEHIKQRIKNGDQV